MGAAQISFGERRQDRAVLLLAGEVDVAHQTAEQAGGVQMGANIIHIVEGEARDRKAAAGTAGILHGAIEIAPERGPGQQSGGGIENTFGFKRFEHAREMAVEGLQAHEGHQPVDQHFRVGGMDQVRQPLVAGGGAGEDPDRQVAKACIARQHGEHRVQHARAEAVADHHALDVTGVEAARGRLHAHGADQMDTLAHRDRKLRIGAAPAHADHGRLIGELRRGQRRCRRRAVGPAQHGRMQVADAQCRMQTLDQAAARLVAGDRKRAGQGKRIVRRQAGEDRREQARGLDAARQRLREAGIGRLVGEDQRARLDLVDGGMRIGPARLDDWKRAGRIKGLDRLRGRTFGDDDHWTEKCHGNTRDNTNGRTLRIGC